MASRYLQPVVVGTKLNSHEAHELRRQAGLEHSSGVESSMIDRILRGLDAVLSFRSSAALVCPLRRVPWNPNKKGDLECRVPQTSRYLGQA